MFRWFKQQKRLDDLEATCEKLRGEIRKLELEWTEMYDKFRLLYMRVAKRAERLERVGNPEEGDEAPAFPGGPGAENPDDVRGGHPLGLPLASPRARAFQSRVVARRSRIASLAAPKNGG